VSARTYRCPDCGRIVTDDAVPGCDLTTAIIDRIEARMYEDDVADENWEAELEGRLESGAWRRAAEDAPQPRAVVLRSHVVVAFTPDDIGLMERFCNPERAPSWGDGDCQDFDALIGRLLNLAKGEP